MSNSEKSAKLPRTAEVSPWFPYYVLCSLKLILINIFQTKFMKKTSLTTSGLKFIQFAEKFKSQVFTGFYDVREIHSHV